MKSQFFSIRQAILPLAFSAALVASAAAPDASNPTSAEMECKAQPFYGHRADGQAGRAITLTLNNEKLYGAAVVEIECAGRTETVPLENLNGVGKLTVLLPAGVSVENECMARIALHTGKRTFARTVVVPAQRQWKVYIYPHSHVDIGYTAPQDIVEKIHMRNVDVGIDLGRKTASYPAGARSVWNTEAEWVVDSYLRNATPEKKAAFIEAVKKGWIGLDAGYDNSNTSAASGEELLEFFRKGMEMRRLTGAAVDTMAQMDVPGLGWGIVQAAAQCGVRGIFSFPNSGARIGNVREAWEQRPFWWVAPDGKTRVFFLQGLPYGYGYVLKGAKIKSRPYRSPDDRYPESITGRLPNAVSEYRKDMDFFRSCDPTANFLDPFVFDYTARLEREGLPYDIYTMTWALADNSFVDADLPDAVKAWNEKYAYPKLIIAGLHEILGVYVKRFGEVIPEMKGDYTEYWTDGLGTDALSTGLNREAKERLVQAETLWAILRPGTPAPIKQFEDAWRWVLLGSEHTWGYYNPTSIYAKPVQDTKMSYVDNADRTSRALLAEALKPVLKQKSDTIAVLNSLSWRRTGVVVVAALGGRVLDHDGNEVPSQRMSTGELAFLATDVPAFGFETYRITGGKFAGSGCKIEGHTLDNGVLRATLDPRTGDIDSLVHDGHEFVDTKSSYALNSYRYLSGGDSSSKATGPTDVKITVKENGPLIATLRVESKADGCNALTREIRIVAGQPWIECLDLVDKISTQSKEGIHFGFAFNLPEGIMRLDFPWGVMIPERDQFRGANRNWLMFRHWVDISNARYGVAWTSIEAPLIEIGDITGNILGYDGVWRKSIQPTQTLFSWALNNHWNTNFPLKQGGRIPFRYTILPHGAYDPIVANRFGLEQSRPLLAIPADPSLFGKPPVSRLYIEPACVLATALKPSDDGKAIIVRLFNASGKAERVTLTWTGSQPQSVSSSNMGEESGEKITGPIDVLGRGIVSLRAEFQ